MIENIGLRKDFNKIFPLSPSPKDRKIDISKEVSPKKLIKIDNLSKICTPKYARNVRYCFY
jgi:hypothetical protein